MVGDRHARLDVEKVQSLTGSEHKPALSEADGRFLPRRTYLSKR
jgi:hypothetical protein